MQGVAAFALRLAAWSALTLIAPDLPAVLALALAIALFIALSFLPGRRCGEGCELARTDAPGNPPAFA